jgi:hypothetical protein
MENRNKKRNWKGGDCDIRTLDAYRTDSDSDSTFVRLGSSFVSIVFNAF